MTQEIVIGVCLGLGLAASAPAIILFVVHGVGAIIEIYRSKP